MFLCQTIWRITAPKCIIALWADIWTIFSCSSQLTDQYYLYFLSIHQLLILAYSLYCEPQLAKFSLSVYYISEMFDKYLEILAKEMEVHKIIQRSAIANGFQNATSKILFTIDLWKDPNL